MTSVTDLITSATAALGPELLTVAGIGIGLGVTVFAVGFGWRFLKSLVS